MKTILLLLSLFAIQNIRAQTILPASRSFKTERGQFISDYQNKAKIDTTAILKKIANKTDFFLKTMTLDSFRINQGNFMQLTDSLYKIYTDTLKNIELLSLVNKLNESSPFVPVLTAVVTNLENTRQTYGSLSLGFQFRLSKYKLTKKGWVDPHYLYLLFSTKTATSPDSSSVQKTFMFPELNKRDFVLGYYWEFLKNHWTVAPTFEFSLNRFVDTANQKSFVSQSFNTGIRIQKSFSFEKVNSFVSLYPYYSLITVDKKYAQDYQFLIGEPSIPSTFHSVGLHISAQVPNAILFCNMKFILNNEGDLKSRDLKRYIYTIGTLLNL
jgi:hypothetical protein